MNHCKERLPHRFPRLAFVLFCIRRWTVDLALDMARARPTTGRRTAPGHPHMALFRWVGAGVQWLALCSLVAAVVVLVVWIA